MRFDQLSVKGALTEWARHQPAHLRYFLFLASRQKTSGSTLPETQRHKRSAMLRRISIAATVFVHGWTDVNAKNVDSALFNLGT